MKNLSTLKTLLKVFHFILWALFYMAAILFISMLFYGDKLEESILSNPLAYNFDAWGVRLYFGSMLVLFFLFASGVSILNKGTDSITPIDPFPEKPLLYKKAGAYFIITGIGAIAIQFLGPLLFINELHLSIDYTSLSAFFIVIIGLFFIFFGEAFLQAKALQKENDLTI